MSASRTKPKAKSMIGTPTDREIRIERVFDAGRDRLWQAFTDPKLVAQWWARGHEVVIERMEVKPGGHWRCVEQGPNGAQTVEGHYREVTPPERLVRTFEWKGMPEPMLVQTVTFEDLGGRTKLVTVSSFPSQHERDEMLHSGMEQGLEQSYAALDKLLAAPGKSRAKRR